MVLDAGDQLETTAFATLGDAMEESGADLAGASRGDLPGAALGDIMFRRSLWDRSRPVLPAAPYGEWSVAVRLVLDASRAVSTAAPARSGKRRGTGDAFGTMPVLAPSAEAWAGLVRDMLAELGDQPTRHLVLGRLLDTELPRYLDDAERCSADQWRALRDLSVHLQEMAPAEVVAEIRVESRVRLHLAAGGHREALERFNADRWLEADQFATRVEAGRVVATLPVEPTLVPPETLLLGASETPLISQLRRMWWDGDAVVVELLAVVAKVPSQTRPRSVSAAWVDDAGRRIGFELVAAPDADVNLVLRERFADHTDGVFRGRVAVSDLLGATASRRWRLEVTVTVAGLTRTGTVDRVDHRGSAGSRRVGWAR